jgi:MFS family permease
MTTTRHPTDQHAAGSTTRAGIALAVIVTCQLMVVLDNTVVNIAIAQIRSDLDFSPAGLSWVINAYTLTFGGLMLLGGRAGDIFGRRRMLIAGLAVFSVASLVGGLAISPAMLVAARAVQGAGAAMAAPSTLALIAATFEEGRPRNKALAIFSGVSAGAGSLGLILGGVLTSGASWRWVLFINVPIGLAVMVLAPRFVPEPPRREGRLDLTGGLLSTAGLASLIYGFILIGEGAASAAAVAGLFAAAVVLLAVFFVVEARSSSPLMPLHLVLHRTRGLVYLVMLSVSAVVFGMFFFISQYAQNDLHYSALRTGLAFLPLTIAIFGFSRIMPPGPGQDRAAPAAADRDGPHRHQPGLAVADLARRRLRGRAARALPAVRDRGRAVLRADERHHLAGGRSRRHRLSLRDVPGDAADRRGGGPRGAGEHRHERRAVRRAGRRRGVRRPGFRPGRGGHGWGTWGFSGTWGSSGFSGFRPGQAFLRSEFTIGSLICKCFVNG